MVPLRHIPLRDLQREGLRALRNEDLGFSIFVGRGHLVLFLVHQFYVLERISIVVNEGERDLILRKLSLFRGLRFRRGRLRLIGSRVSVLVRRFLCRRISRILLRCIRLVRVELDAQCGLAGADRV